MNLKKGDKLYCHSNHFISGSIYQNMSEFTIGDFYTVYSVGNECFNVVNDNDKLVYFYNKNIKNRFYTKNDMRKIKLKKLKK